MYLSKRGFVIKKNSIPDEELIKIKLELRAKPLVDSKFNFKQENPSYPVYVETKNKIYIPKMYGIEKYGFPDNMLDNYIGKEWETPIEFNGSLLERQIEPANCLIKSCKENGGGILELQTGFGKCHSYNTLILMFDGTIKKVQDICKDELLMGDDSTPRRILSLARGRDLMYDIISKYDKYTVNKEHILCLKISKPTIIKFINKLEQKLWKVEWFQDNKYKNKTFNINYKYLAIEFISNIEKQPDIIEIAVKDYIKLPKNVKNMLKGYKTGVEFTHKDVSIDPYIVGFQLGNKIDIIREIPYMYKCNSRENRLKLLAGLIDSSSCSLSKDKRTFDFNNTSQKLINDIVYLTQSLGFSCNTQILNNLKYKISISVNIDEIPILDIQKKTNIKTFFNNVLITNISVIQKEYDNYYGFEIDENKRYVMANFTVTHNTVCALYVLSKLNVKTIIVVNKIPLMNQWKSEIQKFLPSVKIGTLQGQKNIDISDSGIVVAMLQSMARIDYPDELFKDFGAVIIDECFTYNTNIITSIGNIYIGDLYYTKSNKLPTVKTFNEITKLFEYKKILNVFRKKNNNLIEICCDKINVKSTENHRYLTYNGWKQAKDLNINDYIVSNYDKNTTSTCKALNKDQYQIVLSSLLRFYNIDLLNNKKYKLHIPHYKEHFEYCKFKANIFNIDYTNQYEFITSSFYLFNNLSITKTYIPQWILNDLDEKGLAILFIDEIITKKDFYSILDDYILTCFDNFNYESQKRILLKFKLMNIESKYSKSHIVITPNGIKQFIIFINKYIDYNILFKLLPNYSIKDVTKYKWSNKPLDYGYSKITRITHNICNFNKSKFKRNYVFDLHVEDNHNYIVNTDDSYDGLVVHNCHNTASKMFSQILFKLCTKYTIGLSATPKRSDGCEYVFKWHLGNVVYKSFEKREGKPPIIYTLKIDTNEYKEVATENKFTGQKQIQFTSMLSELVDMSKRNLLITELIKDVIKKDNNRKVLVLSDRRTHLLNLKNILDNDLSITFSYGLFIGSMKQKDLTISRASQLILATYQAFGEGVSERDLDTLILITPKKFIGHMQKNLVKNESGKLEQIVGRVFRKQHIERNPIIIDLYDNFSVYKNQGNSRKVFYKQHFQNAIFEEQSINLDDHQNVSVSFIKSKKKTEKIEKNLDKDITNYCILD